MNIGDVIEHDNKQYVIQSFSFEMTGVGQHIAVVILRPVEEPKPDILWERIPDQYDAFFVHQEHGLMAVDQNSTLFGNSNNKSDDWAFPNWRNFIGQTFERPKGGDA